MTVTVNGQNINTSDEELIVSESVDIYECEFEFDSSWDGWDKTAKFEGSGVTKEMVLIDDKTSIPDEVIQEDGWMRVGVYGTRNAQVMPTIWAADIYVHHGTEPESIEITPTPSIYAQILNLANSAKETAEDVAEDWAGVTAEASTLSAGSPASVSFANNKFTFGIPKGDTGATGAKGDKGDTGATGAKGDKGDKGDTGATGAKGDKGDKGDTGATGAKGDKGDKGDNGDVTNIADAYSTSATYVVGDYCIYNSQLYRCTTAITTAEAWTAAHWPEVQLGDEVGDLKSALNEKTNTINEQVFTPTEERTPSATSTGWRLNESNGLCTSTQGYDMKKFQVIAGDLIEVVSDDRFQFQTVASVPSSGTNNRVGDTYGTGTFFLEVPSTATYLIVSTPTASNAKVFSVTSVKTELNDAENTLNEIESAFDTGYAYLPQSDYSSGYIAIDGTYTENVATTYASINITSDIVGKTLYVSGSAWWAVKPYVFVSTDSTVNYAPVPSPSGTITQYTDLVFKPLTTGTLYLNRYSSNGIVQNAYAKYAVITNLKESYLPDDIGDSITYAVFYKPISLTMTQGKLLSGSTGVISDSEQNSYRVSQYVEVEGDTFYLISTEQFWNQGLYAWYDENKNYISGRNSAGGATVTKLYCEKLKSPKNAKYLVIGFLYQPNYTFPFLMEGSMNNIYPSKRWNGKKWAGIGDSLTEAYSVTGAHYFDLICAATGIEFVNLGLSGTGYAKGNSNFMTRALTVDTDSDVVTFFGSGNDASSGLSLGDADDTGTTTIAGCINTAIDNLYSIMPVVQLGIVTPTPWQGNMPSDNGWMENYSNLIVEICKRRSIPCLDLFHCSNLNPNSAEARAIAYARDGGGGTHPSEAGHAIIAPRFLAFLESLLMH